MNTHRPSVLLVGITVAALTSCSGGEGTSGAEPSSSRGSESGTGSSTPSPPTARPAEASGLRAVAGCGGEDRSDHVADFTWKPAEPRGDDERLILSYTEQGLSTNNLLPTTELGAGRSTYHWVGLEPGTEPRYWAVLTLRDGTWSASVEASFPGVSCAGDPSSSG